MSSASTTRSRVRFRSRRTASCEPLKVWACCSAAKVSNDSRRNGWSAVTSSYARAARRLADVQRLIEVRKLPRELANDLDPYVRAQVRRALVERAARAGRLLSSTV